MTAAAADRLSEIINRLQRLDAKAKAAPGQLGFDLSGGGIGPNGGVQCGAGWIDPNKECHKNGGDQQAPKTGSQHGTGIDQEVKRLQELQKAHTEHANRSGHHPGHVGVEVIAGLQALSKRRPGTPLRWNIHGKNHEIPENKLQGLSPRQLSALIYTKVSGHKPGPGQAFGDWFAVPSSGKQKAPAKAVEQPVLSNPGRQDPGLAPKAKPKGINAQDVVTSAQQAQLARQQQAAAKASGDQGGAVAWQQEARKVERNRLAATIAGGQQSQSSLFGVTEYDETMPLFRQRRDSIDPVAQLCGSILREQLLGAQVLDWSRHPRGITAGRAVAEGLVYRFRLDADSIGYKPAWEGINEQQWELRSEGFLNARDPQMRLDFQKVKFQQQTTKRKCVIGYGCGAACISLSKECRVTPSSAISKARLKQLQVLAQEGNATAAARAQELQQQRDTKAQGLQRDRQTARLEKMLQDPRVAEMVRTGKVPEAQGDQGAIKPGKVRDMAPDGIEVDAERFQYKLGASAKGEVGSLSGVQKWDPNLAGVISVWQDPEDGKTYVINGHNRLALAKRLGAEEVTVRYLDAKNAKEARAIGAMQNIAEGQGKETDAAKFFRDSGITTMEEVQKRGLPLNSGKAGRGLALAQLPDEMFQDVIQGNLKVRRAALIGGSGLDQDKQREVYKMLKTKPRMTDETLQEYVQHLAVSLRQTQTEINLFGTSQKSVDTGLARAELSNGLKKALNREARLLSAVSKNSAAVELLEQRGGNKINVAQSQQEAQEATSVQRVFNQLKDGGSVGAALDRAAARLTAGESKSTVQKELREQVIKAMEKELEDLGLRKPAPKNEAPTASLFDSDDRMDAIVIRLAAIQERLQEAYE